MSRRAFQVLAVANLFLLFGTGMVGAVLIEALPGRLAEFVQERLEEPFGVPQGVGAVVLIGLVVAHYGVARFRRWARPVLVVAVIGLILSNLFGGAYVGHQAEVLLFDSFLVLEGVLIVAGYLGPVSQAFADESEDRHPEGGARRGGVDEGREAMWLRAKGAAMGGACSILVGVPVGYVAHEYAVSTYATTQLGTVEDMSQEFYREFGSEASKAAQWTYARYSYNAWRAGALSGDAYHRAQAIGWLRYCTEERQNGDEEIAGKMCEMARAEFRLWDPRVSFSEFAGRVTARDGGSHGGPQQGQHRSE